VLAAVQGCLQQHPAHGQYMLTLKLATLGLGYLGRTGITEIAQPILDRLAKVSTTKSWVGRSWCGAQ
jgi:IclR family transcriptional regulator, acetate operon repressor